MPILGNDLEMTFVGARFGVELDDGAGIQIFSISLAEREIGRRIASRHVKDIAARIERVRSPGCPASNRLSRRRAPGRAGERRWYLRSTLNVSVRFWDEGEFPDHLPRLGIERIHTSFYAFYIAAGIADEDNPVPDDRRGWYALASFWVGDTSVPYFFAGLEIIGKDAAVLRSPKQHIVIKRGTAAHALWRGRRVSFVDAPILLAGIGIDRKDIVFGREHERPFDLQQTGIETGILPRVIGAQD